MMNFSSVNENNSSSSMFFDKIKPNLKIYNDERFVHSCLRTKISSEKLTEEILELIERTPQDVTGEKWQNYVIFKDPKAFSLNYSQDQERYGNWMHHTVKIAIEGLKEKEWSFKELLDFLRFGRHYIGADTQYGNARKSEMETAFYEKGPYMAINDFYKSYLPNGETCKVRNVVGTEKKFIHIGHMNQEKIKLSRIVPAETPARVMGLNIYGSVIHTKVKKIERIMNFVETELYQKALQENDKGELIKELGRIYWWICQAKPWTLGDPSIAEMLIRTIFAAKGFGNPAWKDGIIPWVEVSNEPDVEKFAQNFHNLFK